MFDSYTSRTDRKYNHRQLQQHHQHRSRHYHCTGHRRRRHHNRHDTVVLTFLWQVINYIGLLIELLIDLFICWRVQMWKEVLRHILTMMTGDTWR